MTDAPARKRPIVLGAWLILAGAIGFWAAFTLTLEKFAAYEHPGRKASCDFSVIVQCTANLNSPQGALFGFPNPLIGIAAWPIVAIIGVALIAGVVFPRWFWIVFNLGIVGSVALVIFLVDTSIFHLATLCIYCMITWLVTIPTFWAVTLRNISTYAPPRAARVGRALYGWVPIISLVCYVIIAVLAQVQLDVIRHL